MESDHAFTAEDSRMEVQIIFSFDARELAGKELVTFEELYDVTNPEKPDTPGKAKTPPQTGDNMPVAALLAVMGISAITLLFAAHKRACGRRERD